MKAERSTAQPAPQPSRLAGNLLVVTSALVFVGVEAVETAALPESIKVVVTGALLPSVVSVVALLVSAGLVTTLEPRQEGLWLFAGWLLMVGVAPSGLNAILLLATLFVLVGTVTPALTQNWSVPWLIGGVLVALAVIGTELYSQITGYGSVMVVVSGAIALGGIVTALAVPVPNGWTRLGASLKRSHSESDLRSVLVSGVATERGWFPVWVGVGVWSFGVCVLHFSGLAYGYYTMFWWWDVMTHTLSGAGLGAWMYLLRPAAFRTQRRLFVALVAVVFLLGAGFEIYEYLFREFYEPWSVRYYLQDTVQDMFCNLTGAVLFSLCSSLSR